MYGHARLSDEDRLHQARQIHREYFVRFAEAAELGVQHADYRVWQRRIIEDYENLRSAFDGALRRRSNDSAPDSKRPLALLGDRRPT
jgi:hypothetical protein